MDMRPLGRTGLHVPSICLGTMTFGEQTPEADAFAQMDLALERGINFFDTAEIYAIPPRPETSGETERIIGRWFAARGKRDAVILASKVIGRSSSSPWMREDGKPGRVNKAQIDYAVENSLRRLQTDYIDLYQIHWPDRECLIFGGAIHKAYQNDFYAFEDQLGWLKDHITKGNIRHVGVSNETPYGVMKFLAASDTHDLPRIASVQNAYSLLTRTHELGLSEIAQQEQVGLLAYSPLAQGILTGKYRHGAQPADSRRALFNRMTRYETPNAAAVFELYFQLAERLNVSILDLALKFVETRPFTTSVIIGAKTVAQLHEVFAAFDLRWTPEYEKEINALHYAWPNPCP